MNFHVDELIAAFLAQELDENSTNELLQWVNASAANELYFRQKLEEWSASIDEKEAHRYNKNKAFQQFRKRLLLAKQPVRQSSTRAILRYLSHHKVAAYAAMLLIIAGVGGFAYMMKGKPGPGLMSNRESAYVQVSVAPGETRKMLLPDSTVVWLNAGSTFKYPENFNASTREVFLDGEGYFEVTKNANHPFTVSTSKGRIVVMGTTFNVSAYAGKPRFVTALLEGRVRVNDLQGKSQDLLPMKKAELVNGALIVSDVTDTDSYKWKEGLISFDNEPISEVLDHLANSFGQKIVIQHLENPDLLLTGKFRITDGLAYALKVLGQSYDLKYVKNTRDGSYIILN